MAFTFEEGKKMNAEKEGIYQDSNFRIDTEALKESLDKTKDVPDWLNNVEKIKQEKQNKINPVIKKEITELVKDKEGLQQFKVEKLPSNNRCYPEDVEITYSAYEFDDFEIINNANVDLYDRYTQMLKGIITKGMHKLSLTFGDFLFLSITRKLEAFGATKFHIPYYCPYCKQEGQYDFSLDMIDFNVLEKEMPIKVKLHSYPDSIMTFQPHTIGDVLMLLENDYFYLYNEESNTVMLDKMGNPMINSKAILAASCVSHDYDTAYNMIAGIYDYRDYDILTQLATLLNHGIAPFEFLCQNPIKYSTEVNEEEEDTDQPKLPEWLNSNITRCNHLLSLDIKQEDVLVIPFRDDNESSEYGIIS